MGFSELKEKARNSLKGHYKDAIIMMLVMGLVSVLFAFVGGLLDSIFKTTVPTQTIEFLGQKVSYSSAGLFAAIFTALSLRYKAVCGA